MKGDNMCIFKETVDFEGASQGQKYIDLSIPSNPEYVSIVRLTASVIANSIGFDFEEIEDIKVAVSEACNNVVVHSKLFSRFECTTTLLQASLTATLISSISSKSKPMLFAITEAVSLTIETYSGFAGIDKSMHFCPSLTHSKSIFSLCMPILSPFILIFLYYEYFIKPRNTEQFKNIGPGIDYYKILVFFLKFLQYSNQNAQSATVDVGKLPAV